MQTVPGKVHQRFFSAQLNF